MISCPAPKPGEKSGFIIFCPGFMDSDMFNPLSLYSLYISCHDSYLVCVECRVNTILHINEKILSTELDSLLLNILHHMNLVGGRGMLCGQSGGGEVE